MKRLWLLFLLVTAFAVTSCGPPGDASPDRLFLITLDTTRADAVDYSLENNTTTPHLAALAAEGMYFDNAYSLIPITLPAHAAMFYSLPPHQLKLYNNSQAHTFPRPTVAQLLKSKHFDTAAVISLGVLKSEFGLAKGFDRYEENFPPHLWIKKADAVNRDAIAVIDGMENNKKDGARSFYWLHYSDPHEPYFPPVTDGDFTAVLNGKTLFTCRSTDQAVVNLELTLEPGDNALVLESAIPSVFKDFENCKVEYIKFRGFSFSPLKERANTRFAPTKPREHAPPPASKPISTVGANLVFAQTLGIAFRPPAHWTHKKEKGGDNYYSSEVRSELTVVNRAETPQTVRLSFHYSMHMNDEARRQFYREEVRYMDAQLGELIAFLKERNLYEGSAFLVVGDHGEGLGEYREHFGHIHYLNNVFSRVPMIVSGAGVPKKGKRSEPVSILHVAPTLLDLANVKTPQFMLGRSILGDNIPAKKILLETYSPEAYFDAFSLIEYPWQIIFYPGRTQEKLEFFNLDADAPGTVNLNDSKNLTAEMNPAQFNKIKTELINSVLKISRIITATKGKIGKSSKRHREILKSLGYL